MNVRHRLLLVESTADAVEATKASTYYRVAPFPQLLIRHCQRGSLCVSPLPPFSPANHDMQGLHVARQFHHLVPLSQPQPTAWKTRTWRVLLRDMVLPDSLISTSPLLHAAPPLLETAVNMSRWLHSRHVSVCIRWNKVRWPLRLGNRPE
ncbi:hypothetical protein BC567DRAFT_229380 [Phyllosticta citribraziliensis]